MKKERNERLKYWVVFIVSFELNPYMHDVPKIRTFYGDIHDVTGKFILDEEVQYHYDMSSYKVLVLGDDGEEYPEIADELDKAFWAYRRVRS